jgi:Flp pilus assembly protein TadD
VLCRRTLTAFLFGLAATAALANTPDDAYLEKIRFIRNQAQSQSDYQAGVRIFIQSVDSSDGVLMGELGRALMRLQDYDNAQAVLISATRVAPSNGDAQADLSFVSAVRKDCVTSRYAYDQAAAINPALVDQRHVKRGRVMCPPA